MNQKRSRKSKTSSQHGEKDTAAPEKNQVDLTKSTKLVSGDRVVEKLLNIPQVNSLRQTLWFYWRHSSWSYFNQGLFWGGLVSLTSILSAIGGMALTHIDLVEQQISQRLPGNNSVKLATVENPTLTTPLQILLVEVKPYTDDLVGFSKNAGGKSKTILLLKIDPELNLAQVINIPLNSKTKIPGFGLGTVEDAYKIGGMKLLSEAVNRLPNDFTVDRYLRTTPKVFQQLIDSGKITLQNCDPRINDCFDKSAQVVRQQTALKSIRQHFNIPRYLANFETAIARVEPQLDTNISVSEIISVANFIKELEPDRLNVTLLPGYTPEKALKNSQQLTTSTVDLSQSLSQDRSSLLARKHPVQNNSVAVQNTTNNPELGRQVVAYLRKRNFRHVYLVQHIPLELKQTKIMSNYGQVETANYLKNILGFGNLEAKSTLQQPELVLQLGEDALLPINYRF
jgi:anionic cell wall polymer biosynthesis LytR-Cps2A-Psr (LCP) family protein